MSEEDEMRKYYAYFVVGLGFLLVIASFVFNPIEGPDQGLIEWTEWAANYVAIAVAAVAILKVADGTQNLLKNWHLREKG